VAELINKTMDFDDLKSPEAQRIIDELNAVVVELRARKLETSSWYGRFRLSGKPHSWERVNRGYGYAPLPGAADDAHFPWFLYWEIVWVTLHNDFGPGTRVLDLGGSSSLFSYYLASKGADVTTVDIQKKLVDNAYHVAVRTGWKLRNHVMDMRRLAFDEPFDHVVSICVYEHVPMYARIEINREIERLLVDGGRFSITFDYRNPVRSARINSPEDVRRQFVEPSGLVMRGNDPFCDNGKVYLLQPFHSKRFLLFYKLGAIIVKREYAPWQFFDVKRDNEYTFGALFLEKARTEQRRA
jgi:2-polyprenyl-3-methyl-5-hydroxy-6-metoxy-1,4-benzoquinol methylase